MIILFYHYHYLFSSVIFSGESIISVLLKKWRSYYVFVFGMYSAQQSAMRTRSLTEELEETRRAFKEAQEKASRSQNSCTKLVHHTLNVSQWSFSSQIGFILMEILTYKPFFGLQNNEVESLKVHIRRLEDKVTYSRIWKGSDRFTFCTFNFFNLCL